MSSTGSIPFNPWASRGVVGSVTREDAKAPKNDSTTPRASSDPIDEAKPFQSLTLARRLLFHRYLRIIGLLVALYLTVTSEVSLNVITPILDQSKTIRRLQEDLSHTQAQRDACYIDVANLREARRQDHDLVEACYRNETRIGLLEEDSRTYRSQGNVLEEQLNEAEMRENLCLLEKDGLQQRLEEAVLIEFEDFISGLGSGGDSWVSADSTPTWSYGYTETSSPHPLIHIQTWTGGVQTRGEESIVFRPTPSSWESTISIIGFKVDSWWTNWHSGWWRTMQLAHFGKDLKELQVWAKAPKGHTAGYTITVYYWDRIVPERMPRCLPVPPPPPPPMPTCPPLQSPSEENGVAVVLGGLAMTIFSVAVVFVFALYCGNTVSSEVSSEKVPIASHPQINHGSGR